MMKKILLVMNDDVQRRGGLIYILDWVRYAPKKKYKFTICFMGALRDEQFAQEFIDSGVEVHIANIGNEGRFKKNIKYIKHLSAVLKENCFDIVNIHTAPPVFSAVCLMVARLCGVRQCITHSHTAFNNESFLKKAYHLIPRMINRMLSAYYVGVSKAAIESMFGRRALNNADRACVISPRIDTTRFSFSENVRREYQKKLDIEQDFVIGHVGSFTQEKNHEFLVETFRQIVLWFDNAKLLLIGDGVEAERIHEQVHSYNLDERVIFVGLTDRVQDYLCAMDCFVLPSLREGFPIVLLEAQCSGLPCIASDAVPSEVFVTELIKRIPLSDGYEKWAQTIQDLKCIDPDFREKSWKRIKDAGYDLCKFSDIISTLYN